jgi:hypothetical protein
MRATCILPRQGSCVGFHTREILISPLGLVIVKDETIIIVKPFGGFIAVVARPACVPAIVGLVIRSVVTGDREESLQYHHHR